MISFVWSSKYPFLAGTGGSENYTAGHIRELQRRGIPARILTIGHGEEDGRKDFPDITFKALKSKEELAELDDTIVFITYPLNVKTKRQSYVILHCPPLSMGKPDPLMDWSAFGDKRILAPSKFAAKYWAKYLRRTMTRIPAVYPFAENAFGKVKRPKHEDGKTRILFAGRLTPDKGIYTLMAALHMDGMQDLDYELTVTDACSHAPEGQVVKKLMEAHPWINMVPSRRTPEAMADLMAEHDVVVMPSTAIFWQEAFGIVSVEAQHAGCRVVASKAGGLPETNCGGLISIKPDDPAALSAGIVKAAKLGPLNATERAYARTKFTVADSVDKFLDIVVHDERVRQMHLLQKQGALVREQLDFALTNITELGQRIAGDEPFAYRGTRRA